MPQTFSKKYKFTSLYCYQAHYSLNHLFIIGTIPNYDPGKQYYTLRPYLDTVRPLRGPTRRS